MIPQSHRNTSPDDITSLAPNECFLFGSNQAGRHGSGAAKAALKWGARPGLGEGFCGQTYALPTKDSRLNVLSLNAIRVSVDRFVRYAAAHPEWTFLVTQVGCGLARYKPSDIAPLFLAHDLPPNVHLPNAFWAVHEAGAERP